MKKVSVLMQYYWKSFEQQVLLMITTLTNPSRYAAGMNPATLIKISEIYQDLALLP